jgi:hypothetical protein
MATHALPSPRILDDDETAAAPALPLKPSLMRRVYDALVETQRRRAQREIDRVLGPDSTARILSTDLPPER